MRRYALSMPADYRSAPGIAEDVVHHGPVARRTLVWLCLGAVLGIFASAVLAVHEAATVDVVCSHAEGACIVTRTTPLFGVSRRIIPHASIRVVKVDSSRPRKKASLTYAVVLVAPDGRETSFSDHRSTDRAEREVLRDRLVAFLNDRDREPFPFRYGSGQQWSLYLLPALLVSALIALWQVTERVRIAFRGNDRSVHIHRRRWPLRPWSRTVRMTEIARARVTEKEHSNGLFNVALELVSGEQIPLLSRPFYFRGNHQAAADSLQALVERHAKQVDVMD
jgi:hypothetical protein